MASAIASLAAVDAGSRIRADSASGSVGTPVASEGSASNVRVVCRLRPMDEREKKAGTVPAAAVSSENKEVAVVRTVGGSRQVRSNFHFDEVLSSFSTQADVFAATLQPLVSQVLMGYEATAFAYGQTGTGKTYTMEGDADSDEKRGLMPRTAAAVLEALEHPDFVESHVTVSMLEIYNEELNDLLFTGNHQQKIDLMDGGSGKGVQCVGLSEVPVTSLSDVLDLVRLAQERKRMAETRVSARSSRSHCIFTMKVECRRELGTGELENVGKLHLVDLAGSECAKKAAWGIEDISGPGPKSGQLSTTISEQERERRSINQSLLTLGRVIVALREKSGRVPFRDSKLTRLLENALGGSCKTVIIATISPAMSSVDETISTLNYADQASGIRNRPVASSLFRTMMRSPSGTNFDAGTAVAGTASGCSSAEWAELEMKNAYLMAEVEEAQAALSRKQQEVQEVSERADKAEAAAAGLRAEVQAATQRAAKAEEETSVLRDELLVARSSLEACNAALQQMESSALSVAADLTARASHAAGERTAVQQEQMVNLEAQQSSKEQLVSILQQQRLSLQAEVHEVRAELDATKSQLSIVEAELAALGVAQAAKRKQALEAIVTLASRELAQVGDGLDHGVATLNEQLSGIQVGASTISDSIEAASDKAAEANTRATEKALCCAKQAIAALSDVTTRAANLSESSERTMCDAAKQLRSLKQLGGDRIFEDATEEAQSCPNGLRRPRQRVTRMASMHGKENAPQVTATKLGGHDLLKHGMAMNIAS